MLCDWIIPGAGTAVADLGSGSTTEHPRHAGVTERDDAARDDVLQDKTDDREELTGCVLGPVFTTLVHLVTLYPNNLTTTTHTHTHAYTLLRYKNVLLFRLLMKTRTFHSFIYLSMNTKLKYAKKKNHKRCVLLRA